MDKVRDDLEAIIDRIERMVLPLCPEVAADLAKVRRLIADADARERRRQAFALAVRDLADIEIGRWEDEAASAPLLMLCDAG